MAVFLMLIGYWMYLDTTITPSAVVICVVAYNAYDTPVEALRHRLY